MAREPEELVEMRRVLGAHLVACRQAAELSQGQLARAASVDRTTVAHIEKGRSRADERFWTIADQRCRAGGALLAGFRAWETAKQEHEVRAREAQLAEARAKAEELRITLTPQLFRETGKPDGANGLTSSTNCDDVKLVEGVAGPLASLPLVGSLAGDVSGATPDEVIGQLARLLCRWVGAMNRRELLQLLGWATTTAAPSVLGSLDPDEQEHLAHAIASPSRVDKQVIGHLETVLQYCKRQNDVLGPHAVLPTVLAQRNLVRDLLRGCPAGLRSHLLSVYSDMSTSIGFYCVDLNDFDNAWCYFDQAREAAQEAGNTELGIYALCEMSHAAYWQGKAHVAVDTAVAAQSLTGKIDDPLMQVCVADKAAQAYAIDGRHGACMAELEKAQDNLVSAGQAATKSPAYWYHEALIISEKSNCLLQLGKPQEAAVSAKAALTLFGKSYVCSAAFCRLFLGNSYLQCGEIGEAARVIGDAASLAAQTRSARLVKELLTTRALMQPWQDNPAVKGLDDQLVAYGLAPSSAT